MIELDVVCQFWNTYNDTMIDTCEGVSCAYMLQLCEHALYHYCVNPGTELQSRGDGRWCRIEGRRSPFYVNICPLFPKSASERERACEP